MFKISVCLLNFCIKSNITLTIMLLIWISTWETLLKWRLWCVLGLQKLRGWEDVDEELCEMRVEEQSERAEGRLSVLNLFTFRSLRWQLLSVIFMNMGQQLSGVNAVSTTLKHHTDDSEYFFFLKA